MCFSGKTLSASLRPAHRDTERRGKPSWLSRGSNIKGAVSRLVWPHLDSCPHAVGGWTGRLPSPRSPDLPPPTPRARSLLAQVSPGSHLQVWERHASSAQREREGRDASDGFSRQTLQGFNPRGPPNRTVGPRESLRDVKVNPAQPRGTGPCVLGMPVSVRTPEAQARGAVPSCHVTVGMTEARGSEKGFGASWRGR